MEGVYEVDALIIRPAAEPVGAVEDDVAGLIAQARGIEQQRQRHPGPFADRRPALDAIVAGDLRAPRHRPDLAERQRQRAADEAVHRQPPIGEAAGGEALIIRRVRSGRAVGAEDGGHLGGRIFAGHRRAVGDQPLRPHGAPAARRHRGRQGCVEFRSPPQCASPPTTGPPRDIRPAPCTFPARDHRRNAS